MSNGLRERIMLTIKRKNDTHSNGFTHIREPVKTQVAGDNIANTSDTRQCKEIDGIMVARRGGCPQGSLLNTM